MKRTLYLLLAKKIQIKTTPLHVDTQSVFHALPPLITHSSITKFSPVSFRKKLMQHSSRKKKEILFSFRFDLIFRSSFHPFCYSASLCISSSSSLCSWRPLETYIILSDLVPLTRLWIQNTYKFSPKYCFCFPEQIRRKGQGGDERFSNNISSFFFFKFSTPNFISFVNFHFQFTITERRLTDKNLPYIHE